MLYSVSACKPEIKPTLTAPLVSQWAFASATHSELNTPASCFSALSLSAGVGTKAPELLTTVTSMVID
jgi:hypothetical protein